MYTTGGKTYRLGYRHPDHLLSGAPLWRDVKPMIAESEWKDCDYRAFVPRPRYHQANNDCVGNATAGAFSAAWAMSGQSRPFRFLAGWCYSLVNGGADAGAMVRDAAEAIAKYGVATDRTAQEHTIYSRQFPAASSKEAERYKPLEWFQCTSWEEVGSAVQLGFVVVHGFVLGKAFFNTGSDGMTPPWDGRSVNGHAMFTAGYKKAAARNIVVNSWGDGATGFGDNGDVYLDKSYYWTQSGNFINLDAFAIRCPAFDPQDPEQPPETV